MSSKPSRGAARLAAILDALPDALLLVNANGTVVNANTIALEFFETSGWALVGRGLLDLLPEFDSRLIPGSMRRPDATDELGRTKPRRMTARRTDGFEFPVEVTSANLKNSRDAYESQGSFGDELLMLVVRDLSGTLDTEAELARSQRQTEMILRAAAEGVVGTDTEGRVVLVNPAAAQILGYRASDLGGQELHPLVQHSRADGTPFPYEESALSDTLRSGRKHRVRGQVMWTKSGGQVPVDLTTAPVRDGEQLVGAVLAFTDRRAYDEVVAQRAEEAARHAEELARAEERYTALAEHEKERHAALAEREKDRYEALAERESERYEALAARHAQLLAVLGESLRGPLDELRRELGTLAADPAGQLWPEANQMLHHLSAGYARMSTLVDNVLGFQRLDAGAELLRKEPVLLDGVVAAGVEGAVELIGPGRAQFAVHAPPIEAEVDPARLATALAHLVADVAGIDSTGHTRVPAGAAAGGGYVDSTIVVAAAQRGDVVRIEVRGPYAGGDPVHGPIVRGIVRAHGGVLQTHEVPGMAGSAFVLEVPVGAGAGAVALPDPGAGAGAGVASGSDSGSGPGSGSGSAELAVPERQQRAEGGGRRARPASVDAFLANGEDASGDSAGSAGSAGSGVATGTTGATGVGPAGPVASETPTGRRRRRGAPAVEPEPGAAQAEWLPAQNAGENDTPGGDTGGGAGGTGRRRRRALTQEPPTGPAQGSVVTAAEHAAGASEPTGLGDTVPPQGLPAGPVSAPPTGRRARRNPDGARAALPAANPVPDQRPRALGASVAEPPAAQAPSTGTPGAQPLPSLPGGGAPVPDPRSAADSAAGVAASPGAQPLPVPGALPVPDPRGAEHPAAPTGRRARRALNTAVDRGPEPRAERAAGSGVAHDEGRSAFALPPAAAHHADGAAPDPTHGASTTNDAANATASPVTADPAARHPHQAVDPTHGTRHDTTPQSTTPQGTTPQGTTPQSATPLDAAPLTPTADHTPPQSHPAPAPTGRRRAAPAPAPAPVSYT
ncbi:PAS domain-containing protein, partial [Streptomyces sp. O3]